MREAWFSFQRRDSPERRVEAAELIFLRRQFRLIDHLYRNLYPNLSGMRQAGRSFNARR
jgi:hypothetical protein